MAKLREKRIAERDNTEATSDHASGRNRGRRGRKSDAPREVLKRICDAAAGLVALIATIICVLLALRIAFVVFSANNDNSLVHGINELADRFAWRFRDMFVPHDEKVRVLVNDGIAAAVYLSAGRVVAGLIRRIP
jgi:lipopolysaccharide/colanic/teichoic acid biosynthesis glycosyltransferase